MRQLTQTLLAAQKQPASVPYVSLISSNKIAGVTRLDWERLYTGEEPDYFHAVTMPGDGSLIRVRIGPPSDSRKLYWQRTAQPGPGAGFSQWTYTGQYDAVIVAAASLGAEVSIFWIKSDRKIQRIKSTDYGQTWSAAELIDYSPTTAINGISAAYKPNGDLALFFADQSTLYAKKLTGGQWQSRQAWDKNTGALSGVAAVYDGDWELFVTGQDAAGGYRLWSLVYGDGGRLAVGSWSALGEFARAPQDAGFEFHRAFLDKPDVFRCFYIEKFTGNQQYNRPFWSHSIGDDGLAANLWREPAPFDLSSEYGLAIAHHGDYCWLSSPGGVWRASLTTQNFDLTGSVISIRQVTRDDAGRLIVELDNSDGRFSALPAPLSQGCQLELSPGYRTSQGNETSQGQSYFLEGCELRSSGGKASLTLFCLDGWGWLEKWCARYQLRWNATPGEASVEDIIRYVLSRAGLKLVSISHSDTITGFYPDFIISPGTGGIPAIGRLLSFVPDLLFIEGDTAYLINPLPDDVPVYSYVSPDNETGGHTIFEGRYRNDAAPVNRIQAEGLDAYGSPVIADSFFWEEIETTGERFEHLEDANISTAAQAAARGQARIKKYRISSVSGALVVPVNCGHQLFDVISITDSRAGLESTRRRIAGIELVYDPNRSLYRQTLLLCAV